MVKYLVPIVSERVVLLNSNLGELLLKLLDIFRWFSVPSLGSPLYFWRKNEQYIQFEDYAYYIFSFLEKLNILVQV